MWQSWQKISNISFLSLPFIIINEKADQIVPATACVFIEHLEIHNFYDKNVHTKTYDNDSKTLCVKSRAMQSHNVKKAASLIQSGLFTISNIV